MEFTKMRNLFFGLVFALILVVGIVPNTTMAANLPKVQVCHRPPGNPANFHTINISQNALPAHLAHGDLVGACNALCAILCDDADACTIDDTGNCETSGCPSSRTPVNCSDSNLCTIDTCDPGSGCINTAVTCSAPDPCTVSACSPATGACVDTPTVCPAGSTCNVANGLCEDDSNPDPECDGQTCLTFTTCNEGGSCNLSGVCGSIAEGGGLCTDGSTVCAGLVLCPGGTSDCPASSICMVDSCCGDPVCVPSSQFCSDLLTGPTSGKELLLAPRKDGAPTIGKMKE